MIGGLITFSFAMGAGLILNKAIIRKPDKIGRLLLIRKYAIVIVGLAVIPSSIVEKTTGWFATWELAIFFNFWEWFWFIIGFYFVDFLMNKGWIPQYIITEGE